MNKKRCVVFGASGFIGKYLVNELIKNSFPVLVVGRDENKLKQIFDKHKSGLEFTESDFFNPNQCAALLKENDIVFDLVTTSVPATSVDNPIKEIEHNVIPHINFFIKACEKKVNKIIFTSSGGSIYGDIIDKPFKENDLPKPQTPHAIGKLTVEHYLKYLCRKNKIDFTIFRISNPFGIGQKNVSGFGVVPTFLECIENNKAPILYNSGNLIRDFIHVQDVVEAIVLSLNKINKHNVYNLGSGIGISVKELWEILKKVNKSDLNAILEKDRGFDIKKVILDISRFSGEFNWKPRINIKKSIVQNK